MVPDRIPLAADPCCNQRGGVVLSLGRPMRRREFISLIGGAVAWPLAAARAQRSDGIRRVGVLMIPDKSDPSGQALASAFQGRLSELGWNEGRNIKIDYQWGAGNPEVVQRYVADMVATSPDVILANGTPAVSALYHATQNIPVVFVVVADPVGVLWNVSKTEMKTAISIAALVLFSFANITLAQQFTPAQSFEILRTKLIQLPYETDVQAEMIGRQLPGGWAAARFRFLRLRCDLFDNQDKPLGNLAADYGPSDQEHMFVVVTGQYFRPVIRFVREDKADHASCRFATTDDPTPKIDPTNIEIEMKSTSSMWIVNRSRFFLATITMDCGGKIYTFSWDVYYTKGYTSLITLRSPLPAGVGCTVTAAAAAPTP